VVLVWGGGGGGRRRLRRRSLAEKADVSAREKCRGNEKAKYRNKIQKQNTETKTETRTKTKTKTKKSHWRASGPPLKVRELGYWIAVNGRRE
jgi:hypothetical protein